MAAGEAGSTSEYEKLAGMRDSLEHRKRLLAFNAKSCKQSMGD